jgi:hypothetical protein
MKARLGALKVIIAAAHKMAILIYNMIKKKLSYLTLRSFCVQHF